MPYFTSKKEVVALFVFLSYFLIRINMWPIEFK